METNLKERAGQEQMDEALSPVTPEEMEAALKAANEAIREMDEAGQRAKEEIAELEEQQRKLDEGRMGEVRDALSREGDDRSKAESGPENGFETQPDARRNNPNGKEVARDIVGEKTRVSAAERAKDGASHEVNSKFGICHKCEGSGRRLWFFSCGVCKGTGRVETARQEKRASNTERERAASASRETISR